MQNPAGNGTLCIRCHTMNAPQDHGCSHCGAPLRMHGIGTVLGEKGRSRRYRVEAPLGPGGTYRVRDVERPMDFVVKELTLPRPAEEARAALRQIEREVATLHKLSHSGLPRVEELFSDDDRIYLVSEYIEGENLQATLARCGRMAEEEVTQLALGVLEILYFLHTRVPPIVHRNVTPANIVRAREDGRLVLVDYGMVRRKALTAFGTLIGTEGYASPELYRFKGEPRSDLYAVGATMHHLLSGQAPSTPFYFPPIAELVPGVSPGLQAILEQALQRDFTERSPSVVEMRHALIGATRPRPGAAQAASVGTNPPAAPVRRMIVPLQASRPLTVPRRMKSAMPPPPAFETLPRTPPLIGRVGMKRETVDAAPPLRADTQASNLTASESGVRALKNNAHGYLEAENVIDETVLIYVPAGRFVMGSKHQANERPPHEVVLDGYWIARTPVTNKQFHRFVEATRHEASGDWKSCTRTWGMDAPVANVSWNDAMAYCAWAGLRLPTEDEWEYAARGTDGRNYPWGNKWNPNFCRNDTESEARGAVSVGSYAEGASPFGCLDMAGNVWEWTASWYDRYPGNRMRDKNMGQSHRVLRGGSWCHRNAAAFRCTFRLFGAPHDALGDWGFRCARSL